MDPVFSYRAPETASRGGRGAGAEAAGTAAVEPDPRTGGDLPLHGMRIALQPTISVEGWSTEAGSNALAGYTALEDATVVRRLREAGAHICGSTRTSEFGFGLTGSRAGGALRPEAAGAPPGPSATPTDDDADAPVDAELVLDSMGESRVAASRAAVCGFKPSYGLVSRFGLIGLIPSMECCGVLAKCPAPIRAVLGVIAGQDDLDFSLPDEEAPDLSPQTIDPERTTIGVIAETCPPEPGDETDGFRAALDELNQLGFTVREFSVPEYPLFSLVHRIVGSVEASSAAGRYDSVRYGPRAPGAKNWNEMYLLSRGSAFGTLVKSYLIQGAFFQFERYGAFVDACRIRARLVEEMQRVTAQVDFLAFPVTDGAARRSDSAAGSGAAAGSSDTSEAPSSLAGVCAEFASTLFANVTGQPALYLPPVRGAGHPGFQLAGPRLSDGRLLALGELILDSRGGE